MPRYCSEKSLIWNYCSFNFLKICAKQQLKTLVKMQIFLLELVLSAILLEKSGLIHLFNILLSKMYYPPDKGLSLNQHYWLGPSARQGHVPLQKK